VQEDILQAAISPGMRKRKRGLQVIKRWPEEGGDEGVIYGIGTFIAAASGFKFFSRTI
jgi:hypothetical protein